MGVELPGSGDVLLPLASGPSRQCPQKGEAQAPPLNVLGPLAALRRQLLQSPPPPGIAEWQRRSKDLPPAPHRRIRLILRRSMHIPALDAQALKRSG